MDEDIVLKFETIELFLSNVLSDMKNIKKTDTKMTLLAYISAWENELQTINYIIKD